MRGQLVDSVALRFRSGTRKKESRTSGEIAADASETTRYAAFGQLPVSLWAFHSAACLAASDKFGIQQPNRRLEYLPTRRLGQTRRYTAKLPSVLLTKTHTCIADLLADQAIRTRYLANDQSKLTRQYTATETARPARDTMVEQVLRSLKYPTIYESRNQIEDAVPERHEWMFKVQSMLDTGKRIMAPHYTLRDGPLQKRLMLLDGGEEDEASRTIDVRDLVLGKYHIQRWRPTILLFLPNLSTPKPHPLPLFPDPAWPRFRIDTLPFWGLQPAA